MEFGDLSDLPPEKRGTFVEVEVGDMVRMRFGTLIAVNETLSPALLAPRIQATAAELLKSIPYTELKEAETRLREIFPVVTKEGELKQQSPMEAAVNESQRKLRDALKGLTNNGPSKNPEPGTPSGAVLPREGEPPSGLSRPV